MAFQSTLPIREETSPSEHLPRTASDFNPLFPYGKRLPCRIPAPSAARFQSTLPIREETATVTVGSFLLVLISIHSSHTGRDPDSRSRAALMGSISIHSSHTGRDASWPSFYGVPYDFNPLFPYGKRPAFRAFSCSLSLFQSTLPIREETLRPHGHTQKQDISIHSSHTGRDALVGQVGLMGLISIHSSHTGRDFSGGTKNNPNPLFQSTLPIREETRR